MLRLRLLGDFAVECDGQESRRLRAKKYARLLAYLAMRPNQSHGREELIELFWRDASFESGRTCLRTALSSLRRQLRTPDLFVEGPRDSVKLNLLRITTDVAEFERAAYGLSPLARNLYGGDLLPGFYDDWTQDERHRLQALFETLPEAGPSPEPPKKTLPDAKRNEQFSTNEKIIPSPITRFYGREAEVATVQRLIESEGKRLVSLTGLGGFGKTRLAIEVGQRLTQRVAFVSLSEHATVDILPTAISDVLQVERTPVNTLPSRLRHTLAKSPTVLILDNFEQLVSTESGRWMQDLLEAMPNLSVIVTSRLALGIEGEYVVALSPLQRNDAVQLFIDRARHILPDFPESPLLLELCDCLDGMPLAIELCASWANVLSSKRMLDGLSHRFELMRSRKRTVADRHQSLHAVLEWSCPPDGELRQHLGMLSVLSGRWTIDAADAVLGEPTSDLLEALCERSLVNSEIVNGEIRFYMLESVRDFASEFVADEQFYEAKVRHHRFFCDLATSAAMRHSIASIEAFQTLDSEHVNILTAVDFGLDAPADILDFTVQTLRTVRWCWRVRGLRSVTQACNARLARRASENFEPALMALIIDAAAEHAATMGDFDAAMGLYTRATEMAGDSGNRGLVVQTLRNLAGAYGQRCDWVGATACYEQALQATDPADEETYHVTLAYLAGMHLDGKQDVDQAEPLYRQLLEFWVARGDQAANDAVMRRCLGSCAMLRGQWAEAEAWFMLAIPTFHRLGQTIREGEAWKHLAESLSAQNRPDEAQKATDEWHRLIPPGLVT